MHPVNRSLLLFPLLGLLACAPEPSPAASRAEAAANVAVEPADVDRLMEDFVRAWNADDAAALRQIFADDAILLGDGGVRRGSDEVFSGWVDQNMPVTSDLAATPVTSGSSGDLAYQTGRWSLQVTPPQAAAFTSTGSHTFVWRRQADGGWRLQSLHIDDDPQEQS